MVLGSYGRWRCFACMLFRFAGGHNDAAQFTATAGNIAVDKTGKGNFLVNTSIMSRGCIT